MIGAAAVALVLSACGGFGADGNGGAAAASGGGDSGTGSGWVTDAAEPAEVAAPKDTSEAPAEESWMKTTLAGGTEVVTYRPYLDDGSLAPGFDELDTGDGLWLCSPWRDHFYSCSQDGYPEMAIYFCSTDGRTAWCPSDRSETQFSRYNRIRVLDAPDETAQLVDPAPYRVELGDGLMYRLMPDTVQAGSDAAIQYKSQSPDALWAPTGRSAIDTSSGTWTAYRAPSSGSAVPPEPVAVTRAVIFA